MSEMTRKEAIDELSMTLLGKEEGYKEVFLTSDLVEAIKVAIDSLKTDAVLDELRAKMEENRDIQNAPWDIDYYSYLEGVDKCLETIDEYRKEQE